jgi:prolyl-tRNA synthetase
MSKDTKGITVKKEENFSEWYTQVIQKAELADYTSVSGCIVFRPRSYAVWERVQAVTDRQFKVAGIKNAYFPLFIPENLLKKEAQHVEHFAPEVAWVTHGGDTKLGERLAIRPTSEMLMYESYAKWIRSYNDLPLRLNQWNNVVRWEFKHPTPFLRTREFLWNEGHTVFATKEEALAEQDQIVKIYQDVCENYFALPPLIGRKSEREKFAGAVFTVSLEFVMPDGKGIQGPDFHHDGQNFAKASGITFTDQEGNEQYVWQNTFAISTRMLGVLFAIHSDDKGLVLPPQVAPLQVVIIPILFDDSKKQVLEIAATLQKKLERVGISTHIDDREQYSPGWKFNEWELKGVPLRLELGPRDLEKQAVMVARRDTGEKQSMSLLSLEKQLTTLLQQIQDELFKKAKENLDNSIATVRTLEEAEKALKEHKIIFTQWCGQGTCEEQFKEKTGAKSLNSPFTQPQVSGKCFACSEQANSWFYFGKSY